MFPKDMIIAEFDPELWDAIQAEDGGRKSISN